MHQFKGGDYANNQISQGPPLHLQVVFIRLKEAVLQIGLGLSIFSLR